MEYKTLKNNEIENLLSYDDVEVETLKIIDELISKIVKNKIEAHYE